MDNSFIETMIDMQKFNEKKDDRKYNNFQRNAFLVYSTLIFLFVIIGHIIYEICN
uniref:Uncharacterized protein n=1 Tax=viral metagenome TaxID=1070528 RepID=A0A6C0KZU7_9ZZZZ